jgi:hypothetical protein
MNGLNGFNVIIHCDADVRAEPRQHALPMMKLHTLGNAALAADPAHIYVTM